MKEPTYQQALSRAWHLVWHHRILWVFGVFVAFLGQFGLGNFLGRIWLMYTEGILVEGTTNLSLLSWQTGSWQEAVGVVWLIGIGLTMLAGLIFLTVTSQGALIYYAVSWFKNKRFDNISKAWRKGLEHFWSILLVNVFYKLALLVLLSLSGLLLKAAFYSDPGTAALVLAIGLGFSLFLYLIVSIVHIYSLGYVVIDNDDVLSSIQKGWNLFAHHVLVSFEIGLLLMLVSAVLVVSLMSGFLIAFFPALMIWIVAAFTNTAGLVFFGLIVGVFLWLLLVVLMASVFNAFVVSTWMYLFVKMHKEGLGSRLAHWGGRLFRKF